MCWRICRTWSVMAAAFASSSGASTARRYASSGTFESTTTFLPPASLTTMSGRTDGRRRNPTLLEEIAVREHPAFSTTRRSCISPHRPRTPGRRRGDELSRLGQDLRLALGKRADLGGERTVRLAPLALEPAALCVDLLERLLDGLDEALERNPLLLVLPLAWVSSCWMPASTVSDASALNASGSSDRCAARARGRPGAGRSAGGRAPRPRSRRLRALARSTRSAVIGPSTYARHRTERRKVR